MSFSTSSSVIDSRAGQIFTPLDAANQPSGRGLLLSPTACSPDQQRAAMLADVSRHILGRTEGLGQLVRTHTGKCFLQMGTLTTVPCAHAEDSGLLGSLQSPNWIKVCMVSTVFFLPVSIEPRVEKCPGPSVGDRSLSTNIRLLTISPPNVTLHHEMSRNVPRLFLQLQGICCRGVKMSILRFWL